MNHLINLFQTKVYHDKLIINILKFLFYLISFIKNQQKNLQVSIHSFQFI